jgi:hypothetical protein
MKRRWLVVTLIITTLLVGVGAALAFIEVACPICEGTGGFPAEYTDEESGKVIRGDIPCRACRHGRLSLYWRVAFRLKFGA